MGMQRRAGADLHYIHDRMPLAVKLPNLFVRDVQGDGNGMLLPCSLRMYRGKIESPARNRIQNAHQGALRVAITDVKDWHGRSLVRIFCLLVCLSSLFVFLFVPEHHLRKRGSRWNHGIDIRFGMTIKNQ